MKLATWNVNSLRVRLPHVQRWSEEHQPDIVCLQETKTVDENFPASKIEETGYSCSFHGQKTYNGVAVLVRGDIEQSASGLPGYEDPQARVLAVTVNGVRVIDVYVPNGSSVGSDKYEYKLEWFGHLIRYARQQLEQYDNLVITGDFNIAPADEDVHDPEVWKDKILCSQPERQAYQDLLQLGLFDVYRKFDQPKSCFTWWDYRAASFRRNLGLRIDLILASKSLHDQCTACYVDVEPRTWQRPSDHTPVVAEFKS